MFGFSFGELVVLMVVAIVVIGPKDLPKVLRKLGQWSGKLRRMASDLRAQSGIDDVLRNEGLSEDIAEIRKLARGELDNVVRAARVDLNATGPRRDPATSDARHDPYGHDEPIPIDREREYPRDGGDSYRALPDTAIVYAETLPVSPHAKDALYMLGDANGVMPTPAFTPEPESPEEPAPAEPHAANGAHASSSSEGGGSSEAAPEAHADASVERDAQHEGATAAPIHDAAPQHPSPTDPGHS